MRVTKELMDSAARDYAQDDSHEKLDVKKATSTTHRKAEENYALWTRNVLRLERDIARVQEGINKLSAE